MAANAGRLLAVVVPDFKLIIAFVGPPASLESVQALTQGSPLPVELRADRPRSFTEMRDALEHVEVAVEGAGQEFEYDVELQSGTLLILGPEEPSGASLTEAEERVGMTVRFERAELSELAHTYGGATQSQCTSGFTVRHNATGVTGVLTAAHCSNALTYTQPVTGPTYSLTWQNEINDWNQDFQWMTSAHDEYPQFWDGQYYRTVVADEVRANMVGDWVCHRGKTTGTSCGTITSVTHDPGNICGPNGNGDCEAGWVRVEGPQLACFTGDSGGPLYTGGTAYGIMKSAASTGTGQGQCQRASFMAIGFIWFEGLDLATLKG